jgi:predicted ATP-grasp superfamily ATP-dependent carboligase
MQIVHPSAKSFTHAKPIRRVLILGASVRPVVVAAQELGLEVIAADLFADQDTRDAAHSVLILQNYADILHHLPDISADAWLFTGGIENYPRLVTKISRAIPLLGNSARSLRQVQNPFRLASAFRQAGIAFPEVFQEIPPNSEHRWLKKSWRSVGGMFTHWAVTPTESAPLEMNGRSFHQRWIEGKCGSLAFVASSGTAELVGSFQQHVGRAGLPFGYVGNTFPMPMSKKQQELAKQIGNVAAKAFQLQGLFGVDVISHADELVPIEINPRVTAAMELVPQGLRALLETHLNVFRYTPPASYMSCAGKKDDETSFVRSKWVAFAQQRLEITQENIARWQSRAGEAEVQLADLPVAPLAIPKDHPVLTVLAKRTNREEAIIAAQRFAAMVGNGE